MSINNPFRTPEELPSEIPVFPLSGALLLPRGQLPLNIFEPRYLAMIDAVLTGDRIIGMVQPVAGPESEDEPALQAVGCAGRITQVAETGDGRYVLTLTGVARFRIVEELHVDSAFRKCRVDYTEFAADLTPRVGEDEVDRGAVVQALRDFAKANQIKVDWDAIDEAPNEALVNALSMMCPFGAPEKQALLEAPDLRTRAEVLVAITEIELARSSGTPSILQ
jgi:Lon protease-like protein